MLSNLATLGKHLEMVLFNTFCFASIGDVRAVQPLPAGAAGGAGSRLLCPPSKSKSRYLLWGWSVLGGRWRVLSPNPRGPCGYTLSFKGWKGSGTLVTIYFSPSNQVFSGIPARFLRDKTPQIGLFSPRRSPIRAALRGPLSSQHPSICIAGIKRFSSNFSGVLGPWSN